MSAPTPVAGPEYRFGARAELSRRFHIRRHSGSGGSPNGFGIGPDCISRTSDTAQILMLSGYVLLDAVAEVAIVLALTVSLFLGLAHDSGHYLSRLCLASQRRICELFSGSTYMGTFVHRQLASLWRWLTAGANSKNAPGWIYVSQTLWAIALIGLFLAYVHSSDHLGLPQSFGRVPVEAPWLGAVGGLLASLGGIVSYSHGRWEPRFNYWHLMKPLMGAASGAVACLLVIVVINTATASTSTNLDTSALDAAAFVFGFAESKFRTLITAVTNIFLTPGSGSETKKQQENQGAPADGEQEKPG
jgi:hypothetical protein